jgi:ABC-type multidrug transport system permease subunit
MAASAPQPRRSKDSFIRQMIILARRQFDLIRFDWRTLFILLLMLPMLGALFAMVSSEQDLVGRPGTIEQIDAALTAELEEDGLELDEKVDYIPSVNAELLITMMALALTQGGTFAAAYEIVKERAIYKREKAVNLKATAYVLSKILVLAIFAVFQVALFLLMLAIVVDFGFRGAIVELGILELFVSLYLAVLASIAFGLFISAIVPNQDVVLYAILAQLFVQIILTGTLFPLDNSPVSVTVPGYWAAVSAGSTVNLPGLNEDSRVCSVNEIPNMQTGAAELQVICTDAKQDLKIPYEHTEENVLYTWFGMIAHTVFWVILTIIVQARKKVE